MLVYLNSLLNKVPMKYYCRFDFIPIDIHLHRLDLLKGNRRSIHKII